MKIDEYDANISSDVNEVILALPEDATGNVAVYVNGELYETVAVENGEASTTLKKPGNYTVRMDYEGDNVYASVNFECVELMDNKEDGTVIGEVEFILYKGNHYHLTVLTESGEKVYVDTNDIWDKGDIVGITIAPNDLHITKRV